MFKFLSAHRVGNPMHEEPLQLGKRMLSIDSELEEDLLAQYFLGHFRSGERYQFYDITGDLTENKVHNIVKTIFDDPGALHMQSILLAQHLYDVTNHPNIKSGDLFVAYFPAYAHTDDDEETAAIGIFKSETKEHFLQLMADGENFVLRANQGFTPNKLDKGCLILNKQQDEGYRIMLVDRANQEEAKFWKTNFLSVMALNDGYFNTKEHLEITSNFVNKTMPEEFEVQKHEQIDLLNRSIQYFKEKDQFNEDEFAQEVFGDHSVADSFKNFRTAYAQQHEMDLKEDFLISPSAVKEKSKIFKSVLKLDKNFHVYIHGDRKLIEKGVDEDGRKFYKLYYQNEL